MSVLTDENTQRLRRLKKSKETTQWFAIKDATSQNLIQILHTPGLLMPLTGLVI
jgi:hypothetical protein